MGKRRNSSRNLVGCLEKGLPGRSRSRWKDNIKMNIREIGCKDRIRAQRGNLVLEVSNFGVLLG
jgi:hypothetical protein